MTKILFIHGLASSGLYKTADTLRILLKPCSVISPDVPIEPREALAMLQGIADNERPDLVVGLSLGGFWAQQLRGVRKILINPEFHPSAFLRAKSGEMKYLSPRRDGAQSFFITEEICRGYEELEINEFDGVDEAEIRRTYALFADNDELVHCSGIFEEHYPGRGVSYPGGHLPTFPQIKAHLLPLAQTLLSISEP